MGRDFARNNIYAQITNVNCPIYSNKPFVLRKTVKENTVGERTTQHFVLKSAIK